MSISIGFTQKGKVRWLDFWNVFNKGLHGVQFFEYSSYQEPTVLMNFQHLLLKFQLTSSKILEELIFASFSSLTMVKIEAIGYGHKYEVVFTHC